VDVEALDEGQFKQEGGGFKRLNKIFDGKIVNVLEQITEQIWQAAA
jgi:type I restriction enzyme R subunit